MEWEGVPARFAAVVFKHAFIRTGHWKPPLMNKYM